jgi:hypothetical protein
MQAKWIDCVIKAADENKADWPALTDKQKTGMIALEALRLIVKGQGGDAQSLARGVLHAGKIDGY